MYGDVPIRRGQIVGREESWDGCRIQEVWQQRWCHAADCSIVGRGLRVYPYPRVNPTRTVTRVMAKPLNVSKRSWCRFVDLGDANCRDDRLNKWAVYESTAAASMRNFAKLLWPLVTVILTTFVAGKASTRVKMVLFSVFKVYLNCDSISV
jgi:hypothetical protein